PSAAAASPSSASSCLECGPSSLASPFVAEIVDVDAAADVAEEHAVPREARHAAVHHPAVLAVPAAQAVLDLERLALVEGSQAPIEPAPEILGMDAIRPAVAQRLLARAAGEIQPGRAEVVAREVGPHAPLHRRVGESQLVRIAHHRPVRSRRRAGDALSPNTYTRRLPRRARALLHPAQPL